jgi:hypothetical protein
MLLRCCLRYWSMEDLIRDSCNLWLWRCWHTVEDGDPHAWKVVVDGEFGVISWLRRWEAKNLGLRRHWKDLWSTCHSDMCLVVHGRPGLWRDFLTTSSGGDKSRTRNALGRSPVDMPQRYVSCCGWQAWSLALIALMAMVLPRFWRQWRSFSFSIGERLDSSSGWRWPFVSVYGGSVVVFKWCFS